MVSRIRCGLWMEVVTLDCMRLVSEKKGKERKKMLCQRVKILLKAAVNFSTFTISSGCNKSEVIEPSSAQAQSWFFSSFLQFALKRTEYGVNN